MVLGTDTHTNLAYPVCVVLVNHSFMLQWRPNIAGHIRYIIAITLTKVHLLHSHTFDI